MAGQGWPIGGKWPFARILGKIAHLTNHPRKHLRAIFSQRESMHPSLPVPALPPSEEARLRRALAYRSTLPPPATGYEYLQRVRVEASLLPKATTAATHTAAPAADGGQRCGGGPDGGGATGRSSGQQSRTLPRRRRCRHRAPDVLAALGPGLAWRRNAVAAFRETRATVHAWRNRFVAGGGDIGPTPGRPEPAPCDGFPDVVDSDSWHQLCFGATRTGAAAQPLPPLLRVLVRLDDSAVSAVLAMHVRWLSDALAGARRLADCSRTEHGEKTTVPLAARGAWLYALLARIGAPPLAKCAAMCVRQVYDVCSKMRDAIATKLQSDAEKGACADAGVFLPRALVLARVAGDGSFAVKIATLNILTTLAEDCFLNQTDTVA